MKRKICIITGTRAEYGLLTPLMRKIMADKKLELELIVTGMHLLREFGNTVKIIKNDGFHVSKMVEMVDSNNPDYSMAVAIAKGIRGISEFLRVAKPAIVVILGDRTEALAASVAAVYSTIPLAHIHGGDRTMAGLDESARHAITKLANIHFAATKKSRERILKMGEKAEHVFLVGAPGLDSILEIPDIPLDPGLKKPYLIVLQHPVTTETDDQGLNMRETMEAVKQLKMPTVIIYPNSDAGGTRIIQEIEKFRHLDFIRIVPNIPHAKYLNLLRNASAIIGNSSSGILEAPSFKIPSINIGMRQEGRERSVNVLDVSYGREAIVRAVRIALTDKEFKNRLSRCINPYGDGHASDRIVKVLKSVSLDQNLLQKHITY